MPIFFALALLQGDPVIDPMMEAVWRARGVTPADPADDAEFLRRASLDIAGRPPTPDEVRRFLADPERGRAVDALLESDGYAEHASRVWMRILDNGENAGRLRPVREGFRGWLNGQFAANSPWDEMVREMLTVDEPSDEAPQVYYLLQNYNVNRREAAVEIAGPVTGHFLGIQMACARCHDHKYIEEMTQKRFYEMAAYFAHVTPVTLNQKEIRESRAAGKQKRDIVPNIQLQERTRRNELYMPTPGDDGDNARRQKRGGDPVEPAFYRLDDESLVSASVNRRRAFADLLVNDNLQFARAVVNRYWTFMVGTGFVPVGDGFAEHPVIHGEILDALAGDLMEHDYDLKHLIRRIARSRVYQLSSRTGEREAIEPSDFAVATVRPMAPHQLVAAIESALGGGDRRLGANRRGGGDPFDLNPDDPGGYKTSIQQALVLMNDGRLQGSLSKTTKQLLRGFDTPEARIEELFLRTLSRPPTEAETAAMVEHVSGDRRGEAYQDVLWALLNSSEFAFVH